KAEEYSSEYNSLLGDDPESFWGEDEKDKVDAEIGYSELLDVVKERGIVESKEVESIEELNERVKNVEEKIGRVLELLEKKGGDP
ncbi:8785_t:CDS:2, partial [Acaulospora morrowiae]